MQNVCTGFLIGGVASIFFKKNCIIFYSAGFGLGYSVFSTFAQNKQWWQYS
jgi:hypothetical protein